MAIRPRPLLFYNLGQLISAPFIGLPMIIYLLSRKKYRAQLWQKLDVRPCNHLARGRYPIIWIHALSVGEVNAALPLIGGVAKRWPGLGLICSASTTTGFMTLKSKKFPAPASITSMPFDCLPLVRRVIDRMKPDCFVLVETDIWPNWIWELKKRGIPALLVNGSISSRAAERLRRLRPIRDLLYDGFSRIAMQSEEDANRLIMTGIKKDRVRCLGNLKFDIAPSTLDAKEKQAIRKALGLSDKSRSWIAGSTHPGEEALLLQSHRRLTRIFKGIQLVIAPRNPERGKELLDLSRSMGLRTRLRTDHGFAGHSDVTILDTLGELNDSYAVCDAAFVGGTLVDIGGHNLLEPACHGLPVLYGPHIESCRDMARLLEKAGGALPLNGPDELYDRLRLLFDDSRLRRRRGELAKRASESNRGAVSRYVELIEDVL